MMSRYRRTSILTLVLLAALTTACEDTTGPESRPTFDAEAALQDYETMDEILESSAMAGFRAMANGISLQDPSLGAEIAVALGAEMAAPRGEGSARAFAHRMARIASSLPPGPRMSPIISVFNRGKTFAYDSELGRYINDPTRTDGPDNGIRWILYEDDGAGNPDPTLEIGYADLIDEGDGSPEDIALALVVVVEEETRLDYRVTLDLLEDGGKITVDGFIRGEDPADRLDFEVDVEGSEGPSQSSVDIGFEMRIDSREFRIDGSVTGLHVGADETGEIDLSVRHGSESLRITAVGTQSSIDGTFYLHDEVFATIYGDPESPMLEGATGEPLTWAEALVLRHMVDMAEDVFDLFEDLLDPVDELVILALIL
jgi:hypothetical protein